MNHPAFVVHYKITHMADRSVARLNLIAANGLCAPQMRIHTFVVSLTFIRFFDLEAPGCRRGGRKANALH